LPSFTPREAAAAALGRTSPRWLMDGDALIAESIGQGDVRASLGGVPTGAEAPGAPSIPRNRSSSPPWPSASLPWQSTAPCGNRAAAPPGRRQLRPWHPLTPGPGGDTSTAAPATARERVVGAEDTPPTPSVSTLPSRPRSAARCPIALGCRSPGRHSQTPAGRSPRPKRGHSQRPCIHVPSVRQRRADAPDAGTCRGPCASTGHGVDGAHLIPKTQADEPLDRLLHPHHRGCGAPSHHRRSARWHASVQYWPRKRARAARGLSRSSCACKWLASNPGSRWGHV